MKKRKVTSEPWHWVGFLMALPFHFLFNRGRGTARRRNWHRKQEMLELLGLRRYSNLHTYYAHKEMDKQIEKQLQRTPKRAKTQKTVPIREYIEKKLQFLVDCGYTDQYNEIDGEYSLVYKKGSERDGYYIAVYFDEQFESCVIRTPDAPFAELSKSVLATPEWRTSYLHATPSVRLDMAVQFLQREATK